MTANDRTIRLNVVGTRPLLGPQDYRSLTVAEARATIADLEAQLYRGPDPDAIRGLIETADWRDDGPGIEWANIPELDAALDWSCTSCREDVGWAKGPWVTRDHGEVTITTECGHCGNQYAYDANGVELDA